jgi:hypothetical protein
LSEDLDHASGGLQVFPHFVKSLQSHLTHFESYGQTQPRCLAQEPPTFPSAKQIKAGKDFFADSETFFQIRKEEATLIRVCEPWP